MKKQEWSENPFIGADNGSSVTSKIENSINRPLPWVALAFIITMAVSIFSVYRVSQAEAQAELAKQTAFNAETQCLLVRTYTDSLRIEMAGHGIKPPDYPKELK